MEGRTSRARWLTAAVIALHAAAARAQADASPTSTSTLAPVPAAPLDERPPSPRTGDYRWNLSFEFGGAAAGAPNGLLGVGLALGTLAGTRVEANVLLGFSSSAQPVERDPAWNSAGDTYTGAEWSARTVLLELAASRRKGPWELWVGTGVHVSWPQWEGTYSYLSCPGVICFGGQAVPATGTEVVNGSGAAGLLVGAGARLAVWDHLLFGLSARWLGPATSHVGAPFDRDVRMGGLAVGAGLTLRIGGAVPRGPVTPGS